MGTDYRARTLLVVPFTEDDFLETTTEEVTKVKCAHQEAQGNTYCPVCGTHKSKRVVTKTVTTLQAKEPVKDLWPFNEIEPENGPGWLQEFLREDPYAESRLKGNVKIMYTGDSYSGITYWLGFQVAQTDSNRWGGGGDIIDVGWDQLQAQVEAFGKTLAELGIHDRRPILKAILAAS